MKIRWTTRNIDNDELIQEYTHSYTNLEFVEDTTKKEKERLQNGLSIVRYSKLSNGKAYWSHVGQPEKAGV
jgi:hypothetical protein